MTCEQATGPRGTITERITVRLTHHVPLRCVTRVAVSFYATSVYATLVYATLHHSTYRITLNRIAQHAHPVTLHYVVALTLRVYDGSDYVTLGLGLGLGLTVTLPHYAATTKI